MTGAIFLKSQRPAATQGRPLDWVMHPRFQAWLRFKNSEKFNVYCGVNAIAPWKRTRTRDSVGAVRHVFLEADFDGSAVLARIGARRICQSRRTCHSSPNRVHIFWRVTGFGAEQVERLQKVLARELGTDPAATPVTQTSRLVGYAESQSIRPPTSSRSITLTRTGVYADGLSVSRICGTKRRDFRQAADASAGGARQDERASIPGAGATLSRACRRLSPASTATCTRFVCCRLVRGFALTTRRR